MALMSLVERGFLGLERRITDTVASLPARDITISFEYNPLIMKGVKMIEN